MPEPLSLMPGPSGTESRWAPHHDRAASSAPHGVSDHVELLVGRGGGIDADADRGPRSGGELLSDVVADDRRRDVVVESGGGGQRSLAAIEAVVEDQRRCCTGVDRVVVLLRERAGAALDQRHRTGRDAGEVRRITAAVRGTRATGGPDDRLPTTKIGPVTSAPAENWATM